MDRSMIKIECLYYSTTLGLKFKFKQDGDKDFDSKSSVIVLDNNAVADGSFKRKLTGQQVNRIAKSASIERAPDNIDGEHVLNSNFSDGLSLVPPSLVPSTSFAHSEANSDDSHGDPFISLPGTPSSSRRTSMTPSSESTVTKVIVECDELFGIGIKRLLRLETSLFFEQEDESSWVMKIFQFLKRLVHCLKVNSYDTLPAEDVLYKPLWETLEQATSSQELNQFMTVSYHDLDVDDYVSLYDLESWKEFIIIAKKRVKVILRAAFLAAINDIGNMQYAPLLAQSESNILETPVPLEEEQSNITTADHSIEEGIKIMTEDNADVQDDPEADDYQDDYDKYLPTNIVDNDTIGEWLTQDQYHASSTFLIDNDADLIEMMSNSEDENDSNFNISRVASEHDSPCNGSHWIKSPHHVPPIGATVLSVNGVNISLLDRDFQLALLKQRRRPLFIVFGLPEEKSFGVAIDPNSEEWNASTNPTDIEAKKPTVDESDSVVSSPSMTWNHVPSDGRPSTGTDSPRPKSVLNFGIIHMKYSHNSMSKVRRAVENILKEYINCDWLTAMRDKTGTPQATIISLYKYIEVEMIKLGLIISSTEQPSKSFLGRGLLRQDSMIVEVVDEDSQSQVSNHIETMIYSRISDHTLQKIAIPYTESLYKAMLSSTSSSLSIALSNFPSSKKEQKPIEFENLSLKLSFLRFVKISQLGLQGLKPHIKDISADELIEREEWRLVMKGLCRALSFSTPSLILSKIVITIRLISQALDALINRPDDSSVSIYCNLSPELDSHHHVDNIFSDEEFEALQLLIASHEKYPSATSTDVLMFQKVSQPSGSKGSSSELSADELLPAIAWSVIQANPSNVEAILWICSEFRHPNLLRGEEAYCLAQLTSAVEFVMKIDETMLDMTKEEYYRQYQQYLWTQKLLDACRNGNPIKEVNQLLESGADINGLTIDQNDTPLTLTIRNEHHHLISHLIKQPSIQLNRCISPCKGQNQNSTALIEAVRCNQIATVLKLLKYGSNRYHTDDNGYTALSIATEHSFHDIVIVLQADPYRINYLDAIESQEVNLIRGLLLQNVDINMFLYDPVTAYIANQILSSPIESKEINALSTISVDLMLTPLMAATGCSNLAILRTIIDAENIDINITNESDPYQDTALSYCIKRCCMLAPTNFQLKIESMEESPSNSSSPRNQENPLPEETDLKRILSEITGAHSYHVLAISILIQAGAKKDCTILTDPITGTTFTPLELIHKVIESTDDLRDEIMTLSLPKDSSRISSSGSIRSKDERNRLNSLASVEDDGMPYTKQPIVSSHPSTDSSQPVLEIYAYQEAVSSVGSIISIPKPLLDVYDLFCYDPSTHEIYELARERNYRGVIALLRQGADINKNDPHKGYTSLIAATFNLDYVLLEILLRSQSIIAEASPLPDQSPTNIYTSVHEPLKPPSFLDINRSGRSGMRALHYAGQLGDVKIISRLLQAGADRYLRNKKGLTAFDVAVVNGHNDAANVLRYDPKQITLPVPAKHGDWIVIKALLNQGVSVNYTSLVTETSNPSVEGTITSTLSSPEMYTALIAAVAHGQTEVVRQLLTIPDIDVNLPNLEGITPLMYAARRGDEATVLKLLKHGANRWLKDNKGQLASTYALNHQHDLLCVLLQTDPSLVYVHDLIRKGDFNGTVTMFKQGIDPNQARYYSKPIEEQNNRDEVKNNQNIESNPFNHSSIIGVLKTPSGNGSRLSIQIQTVENTHTDRYRARSPSQHSKFIERHSLGSSNSLTADTIDFIPGETPLTIACYYGRVDVVRLLLKAPDIKVNQADAQGWTPLHYAAYMNYEDIVIRLLKLKCNRRSFDLSGRTPVDVAIEKGYHIIASLIEADPYLVHIHDMCEVGKILLVIALLKQGCPPTFRDERPGKQSQTPLIAACKGNQIDIVRMLLRYQEVIDDIDAVDEKGMTALMHAAKIGALDITAILLNSGCNRDLTDEKGMTARDYASNHSFAVMFQYMSQTLIR